MKLKLFFSYEKLPRLRCALGIISFLATGTEGRRGNKVKEEADSSTGFFSAGGGAMLAEANVGEETPAACACN